MTTPDLSKLTVTGPFWSADVEVVTLDAPHSNLALRRLFLDTIPRKVAGVDNVLAPGTLLALCLTRSVLVTPATGAAATYEWQRPPNTPAPQLATFDAMRAAIRSGAASLLLLEADPATWSANATGKPPTLTCLAGDISLDTLQPQNNAVTRLFAALTMQEPASASLRPPGKLSVHASGLSILGSIGVPWQGDRVTAMLQLTRVLPPPGASMPAFRLTIEIERLTADEHKGLITAAQKLSGMLNPRYPHNQPLQPTTSVPHWATLELVNPAVPPRLVWPIPAWGTLGRLAFERGEINLLLSDRPPYDADPAPSSLAQILPDEVTIATVEGELVVTVKSGNSPDVVPDPQHAILESPPDSLVYRYRVGEREWIGLHEIATAFSPTETPTLLRTAQDLPVPEWDKADAQPLAQPLLWGFAPLNDGWAQLPIPNLTEQIYLDANLAQLDAIPAVNDAADTPSNSSPSARIRGAVSFSNRLANGSVTNPAEHPWTVTLTDATGIAGIWTLDPASATPIRNIKLVAAQPALTLNGFFWLSTDRPSVADALPSFDNWVAGLRAIPLTRVNTRMVAGKPVAADLFPPLVVLRLHDIVLSVPPPAARPAEPPKPPLDPPPPPDALLESWSIGFDVDNPTLVLREQGAPDVFATLLDRLCGGSAPIFPPTVFSEHEPLVWRRHRNLPVVQALALTQSITPPNEPIAGRQFAPFALPTHQPAGLPISVPDNWRFGVNVDEAGPTSGAATWPQLQNPAQPQPASEWRALPDLPLALLSLPGLQFDPSAYGAASGLTPEMLPLQYRYDLPYTDEIQALAQAPKEHSRPDAVSPLPDEPPSEAPKPLTRDTYAAHWRKLSEQASLAALDAAVAFQQNDAGNADRGTVMSGLIEPLTWPVMAKTDLLNYPGTLTITQSSAGAGTPIELRGDLIAADAAGSSTPDAPSAALRGISGTFYDQGDGTISQTDGSGAAAFLIEAGSMAAYRNSDGTYRDQRGLSRGATAESASHALLRTPARLAARSNAADLLELTSSRVAWSLEIEPGHTWQLWFRDLPMRGVTPPDPAARRSSFRRADRVTSPATQDVNDPEALSREFNYLNGYEWRLADAAQPAPDSPVLRLCGLEFFPLRLERLDITADLVERIELIGRLQLPLSSQPTEITDLGNAVRATFMRAGDRLMLTSVALESGVGEWPLALDQGELSAAPRIVWGGVSYDAASNAITLAGTRLCFHLFGVEWQINLKPDSARFVVGTKSLTLELDIPSAPGPLALVAATLTLQLIADPPTGSTAPTSLTHSATLDLAVRLGRALAAAGGSNRTSFTATVRFALLPAAVAPTIVSATLFDDIVLRDQQTNIGTVDLIASEGALEFAWENWVSIPAGLQILPGAVLGADGAPGCAALTFDAGATDGIPTLSLRVAFIEAVLHARWGAFLQNDVAHTDNLPARIYGSSAGDLSLGFSAHAREKDAGIEWDEEFLLNGLVEIKSLISWPAGMRFDPAQSLLTLPPACDGATLRPPDHVRHTMRVLLNQHHIPAELLTLSEDPTLLFNLANDRPWQTLAVVEHQLIDVHESGDTAQPTLGTDRRWTVLQEVRLMTPAVLRNFLAMIGNPELRSLDPTAGMAPLAASGEGYFAPALRAALLAELDRRGAQPAYLFVEASAPHWLRQTHLHGARPTALQYLPGGSQHAILSGPDDYTPAAPLTPDSAWLLLTTPFLGRLQPAAADEIEPATAQVATGPLAVDPVLALRRGLGQTTRPAYLPLAFAFTHCGDLGPIETRIALLDTAAGRTWTRLDALTLAENWFRLQTPFPEPPPERIPSIMAALPDTPARASRSVALRRAFDVFRPFVPPVDMDAFRLPTDATFRYQLPPEVDDAAVLWRQHSLLAPASVRDVQAKGVPPAAIGMQALYTFAENSGALVGNQTSADHTLDLTIQNPANVAWSNGGLTIQTPMVITSAGAVGGLVAACRASNEISIVVRMLPADKTPLQLSRILSIADDPVKRNVELLEEREDDQRSVRYTLRLRTSKTGEDAKPPLQTPKLPRASTPQHVVYTRDAAGIARLYVNGVEQARAPIAGDFSNWDIGYHLVLGNTLDGARPWRGTYQYVAIYSRALTPDEVKQGFTAQSLPVAEAWHTTAALLCSSGLVGVGQATAVQHYPAATLLPARLTTDLVSGNTSVSVKNPQPLSFAISPYAGMSFRSAPEHIQRALVAAELVCIDPVTGQLRPTANRFFEDQGAQQPGHDATLEEAGDWGRELIKQLAPESPIALLRLREIYALQQGIQVAPDTATIVTQFRFALIHDITPPPKLSRRVARLRDQPLDLRFREGQYGGSRLPDALEAFEVAPPQMIGAQPIYLTERPNAPLTTPSAPTNGAEPPTPVVWPWGLSALRFSVRYTASGRGIIGSQVGAQTDVTPTLWWQAIQYGVQYRSTLHETPLFSLAPEQMSMLAEGAVPPALLAIFAARKLPLATGSIIKLEEKNSWLIDDTVNNVRYAVRITGSDARRVFRRAAPAAGLTALFRAAPIRNFLPVLPDPSLPPKPTATWTQPAESSAANAPAVARTWQPVLPGALRYFLLGARSGAMLATRSQLIRQRAGALVSGSLPMQQRTPRPVPLPHNRSGAEAVALQTWASYFEPEATVLISRDPIDETFYAATATHGPTRLQLQLTTPAHGTIPAEWDGTLAFTTPQSSAEIPLITVTLLVAGETFAYNLLDPSVVPPPNPLPAGPPPPSMILLKSIPDQKEALQRQVAALGAGAEVLVQIKVEPTGAFRQTLTFGLRVADASALRLPLEPYTVHFEDPEYNRALATQAGRAERLVKLQKTGANQFGLFTLTLTTDRRSYNTYSPLAMRFDWDNPDLHRAILKVLLQRVTSKGVTEDLVVNDTATALHMRTLKPGALLAINLLDLRVGNRLALQPDDKLRIKLLATNDPSDDGPSDWAGYDPPPHGNPADSLIQLDVDIVADPVIPAPEAAYALLRRQIIGGQAQVECTRFAWGPNASRIELIAKDDLVSGVVRRRAVFQWRDVARSGTVIDYAVQKIATNGATHIPMEWEKGKV